MNNLEKEQRILMEIGYYFLDKELEKYEYDRALASTYNLLGMMNITDTKTISEDVYEITLCRPGLLIGSKGTTINELSKALGIEIKIKENKFASLVYPLDHRDY